jgi:hypothetical protein
MNMALESKFQANLIKELKHLFPGCMVLKNDSNYIQGVPDLLILYRKHWAALECKRASDSRVQPNQPYYVKEMDKMSFASFIYPENKEDVLDGLQSAFRSRR